VGIVAVLAIETLGFFARVPVLEFVTGARWAPGFDPPSFGVLPLLAGSILVAAIAAVVALPTGLLTAIFLSEYASRGLRRVLKPLLELLAGVPTVVYGYFALTVVTPILQEALPGLQVYNALSAGLVVGLMIVPMVASLSEDALRAVPAGWREAAFSLGATRMQVVTRVVVPGAASGVGAAFLLGVSRALGETMVVTIAAGASPNLTANPLEAVQTMTAFIVQVSLGGTPQGSVVHGSLFAVGMSLFIATLGLNVASQWVLRRVAPEVE
jgi:phosphate transport system permease protein